MKTKLKYWHLGRKERISILLLILMPLSLIYTSWALAQNTSDEICRSVADAQAETQRLKECDVDREELQKLIKNSSDKDTEIADLKKQLAEKDQESLIKDKMMAVKDQMIEYQDKNFQQMKDVADRALKLAEVSKPSAIGNWQLYGLAGLAAAFIGYVLGNK